MRIAILITFLLSVVFFENCGSTSGSGTGFTLNASSIGGGGSAPLTASPLQLSLTSIADGGAFSAITTISGSDLNGVTCTWNINNSSNQAVMTPVLGVYSPSAGSICTGALTAPLADGTYGVTVTVTNIGGELTSNMATLVVGSGTSPAPNPTPVPTPIQTPPTPTPPPVSNPTPGPTRGPICSPGKICLIP